MTSIITVDPATGAVPSRYQALTAEQIEQSVAAGAAAAEAWGRQLLETRVAAVRRPANTLRQHKGAFAQLVTAEMGKPLGEAADELEKSAVTAECYADQAASILGDEKVEIPDIEASVSYEAIGLVLAAMPWNSPNATGSALSLQQIFVDTGLPRHVFTTLVVAENDVPKVTERLINDDRIVAVTLTGSNRAGAAVGSAAGRASKKSVLELGGSDAIVVLDDADVTAAVKARYRNAGQSCACSARFSVAASVATQFTDLFVEGVQLQAVGDPIDAATEVGTVARADLRDPLRRQVDASVAGGAVLLAGGRPVEGHGFFYQPTVLSTGSGVQVFDEETFGPVAAIAVADSDAAAVKLANATPFGLSLSSWTSNVERGVDLAKPITTGAVYINAITASDARVPFAGTKKSRYGPELAAAGIRSSPISAPSGRCGRHERRRSQPAPRHRNRRPCARFLRPGGRSIGPARTADRRRLPGSGRGAER